jgi:hypothetical protein
MGVITKSYQVPELHTMFYVSEGRIIGKQLMNTDGSWSEVPLSDDEAAQLIKVLSANQT